VPTANPAHAAAAVLAAAAALLAASWAVAAESPMGWRGDGTGKYPAADPPTTWGRASTAVKGLRYQARKPKAEDAGSPMPDGVVREWLMLGPVPVSDDYDVKQDALPGEAALDPDEGEKTGPGTWQKVASDAAYLDFARLTGKSADAVAYICTHLYSPTGGAFRLNLVYVGGVRVYVNGKAPPPFCGRIKLDLAKGWNRLVMKFTPGEKDWFTVPVLHAFPPAEYEEAGIAWRTPLPGVHGGFYGAGTGVGAPVIVGDRLYLLSEPHDLICLQKTDGKVLWVRTNSYFDAAGGEEKKHPAYKEAEPLAASLEAINASLAAGPLAPAKLDEKVKLEKEIYKLMKQVDGRKYRRYDPPDVGFSGYTPSTDGRCIYLWLGSGLAACYDLDGNRRWIRVDNRPAVEHGFSSSPLLADGKLVVFMRDLMAFDARTGALAWQTPIVSHDGLNPQGFFHGSPVAATIGGEKAIVLGNGTIVRASDGKILFRNPRMDNQGIASPVVEAPALYHVTGGSMTLYMHTLPEALTDPLNLPTRTVRVDTAPYPKFYMPWHLSSPLVHEGLAYLVNNSGVLTVVDVEKGEIVYQKILDLDPFQQHNEGPARGVGVSPALAGKHLYVFGNSGAALVLEPGRVYRQVAKNKIESVVMTGHWAERQERFVANPVFDGKRLYIRGEGHLYAIGPP